MGRLWLTGILGPALMAGVGLYCFGPSSASQPGLVPLARPSWFHVRGLELQSFGPRGLNTMINAEGFVIMPRPLGGVRWRSLNQSVLYKATIRTYIHSTESTGTRPMLWEADLSSFASQQDKKHPRRRFGFISRSLIEDLHWEVYRGDVLILSLKAGEARLERNDRYRTHFLHATLKDCRSDKIVASDEILWDRRQQEFVIPGVYEASVGKRRARGKGIRIDLNFRVHLL